MKISVIIPVYNTEKYLEQCLESVLNQTLQDIEIICVDDGSTDNSLEILKTFAQKDKRIIILTQQNQGQSVARNKGIEIAKGEYIGFVDSDDWISSEMLEKMYANAEEFESDITMCSFTIFNEKTAETNTSDSYMSLDLFPNTFENRNFSFKETYDFIFRICVSPCNKIYKRDFIIKNNILFPEGLFFEDNVFFYKAFMQSERNSLIKKPFYTYRVGTGTSTVTSVDSRKLDFFKVFSQIEIFLKEMGYYDDLGEYFEKHKKNTLKYWYEKLSDKQVKEEYLKKLTDLYGKSF